MVHRVIRIKDFVIKNINVFLWYSMKIRI